MQHEEAGAAADKESAGLVEATSQPFVGRWNQLISTTNWEKGRIIADWREALVGAGAPVAEYADEAWSRRVGGVTPQHVGRLRRVHVRFGESREKFPGLFWSHFQAALDWDDAEMWLEGAVHSRWSVSEMRGKRWETLGARPSERPREEDIVVAELDEDFSSTDTDESPIESRDDQAARDMAGPRLEGPDFGDEDAPSELESGEFVDVADSGAVDASSVASAVRPFANLPPLPDDLSEALDQLKLVIVRHKTDGWRDVACNDLLAALDALKTLAIAPA